MKFTTCAQVLSAAAIASAAAVSIPGKREVRYGYSHSHKIKGISWAEAVKIMGGSPGGESGGSDFYEKASNKAASSSTTTAIQPAATQFAEAQSAETEPPPSDSCTDNVRIEWNNLSDGHKLSYVQAVKCLMDAPPLGVWDEARNIWDEMTWIHDQLSERIHGLDTFLPWHRYYLHLLRTLLAEQCAYTGPMPWWRETKYTGNFAGSGIFEPEYFGALPPLTDRGEGTCITDGAFANTTILISPGGPSCLARGEDKQTTGEATVATLDLCHGGPNTEYTQHRRCVEQTIHATTHEGLGPTMWLLSTSPGDPIFFMHHGFVDWQWKRWQNVDSARWTEISGCAEYTGDGSACIPMTRDTVLTSMGMIPDMTVGDVLDTENNIMCYTYDEF